MGGGKEMLYGDVDEDFCKKKQGANYKKKREVCLEMQRGQEN